MSLSHVLLVGLNHRTASLGLRESLVSAQDLQEILGTSNSIREVVILSTCNRLEIYVATADVAIAYDDIIVGLTAGMPIAREALLPHIYRMECLDAAKHLMCVAAGGDSMILGEQQILGQIKTAFDAAQAAKSCGAILSRLFMMAIHVGKRARTETNISRHTTSMSHAAVMLAQQHIPVISRALVIGAGEMAYQAASAFTHHNIPFITCINRTHSKAVLLANTVGGQVVSWDMLSEVLAEVDMVITATSSIEYVLNHEMLKSVVQSRSQRPLVIVDVSVPRNVELQVREMAGVTLFDMDDLQIFVTQNLSKREEALYDVNTIIDEESDKFMRWLNSRKVTDTIVSMREKATSIAQIELEDAINKLGNLPDYEQQVLERLVHRVVSKIIHSPTQCIRRAAEVGDLSPARFVQTLFELE